jgi:hypothetical protein
MTRALTLRRFLKSMPVPALNRTMTSTATSKPKLAILDDYQGVSLSFADWNAVKGRVETIDVYRDTLHDENAIVQRLQPYEIICAMRERTKFTKGVLERLPNLRCVRFSFPLRSRMLTVPPQIHSVHGFV